MDILSILKDYGGQGIFFALFLYLFLNTQNESKIRENKLIDALDKLETALDKYALNYENLSKDVSEIKQKIMK